MKKVERALTFKDVSTMFNLLLEQGVSVEQIMGMEIDTTVSDFVRGGK